MGVPARWRVAAAFLLLSCGGAAASALNPFGWLDAVVTVDAPMQARLDRGDVVVGVLPSGDAELGVFAAARVNADGETLASWADAIAQLKKSPYVLTVQRFSDPPSVADVQGLALDEADLADLRRCTPGDCDVKLPAADIAQLRRTADGGGLWKAAVQQQFRELVLGRVLAYQSGGFGALPPYADRRKAIVPRVAFNRLLDRSPYLTSEPFIDATVESFFYWSKEQYGTGKPVIGVTHVDIVRPHESGALSVAVVSREIMATHYRNASLGVTAITIAPSGQHYLVYVNRSQLDVLGGIFGAWKRALVEGRLKNESAAVFNEVRRRLESGPPPE